MFSLLRLAIRVWGIAALFGLIVILNEACSWLFGPATGSLVALALTIPIIVLYIKSRKKTGKFGEVLRGATVNHNPRKTARKLDIQIGGVPIPKDLEPSHILWTGAPGTGKSVGIEGMLDTIRLRGQRAVVYDSTGEFVSHFYRDGIDTILSPLDERSPAWTPWAEGLTGYDFQNVVEALIPTGGQGEQSFWSSAARAITRAVLSETRTLEELHALVFAAPVEDIYKVLENQGLLGLAGPHQMLASSRGTAATYLSSLQYLRQPTLGEAPFSVKAWMRDEEARPDAWLFITSRADLHRGLRPLISMWIGLAVTAGMALSPDRDRRTWFILDELPTLQQLDSLESLLAGARKYGLCGVLGVQSIAQMRDLYGRDAASALLSHPATRLILRSGDSETADWLSATIGDRHSLRKTQSSSNNGGSESEQHAIERAVLPSEILALPSLTGYLRIPGLVDVQKVTLRPRHRDVIADPYKNRPLPIVDPAPPVTTGGPALEKTQAAGRGV